jgi:hypothetical protein
MTSDGDPNDSTTVYDHLSGIQLQNVNAAFEKLFGYKWGTQFHIHHPSNDTEQLLCDILGRTATAKILQRKDTPEQAPIPAKEVSSVSTLMAIKPKVHKKQQQYKVYMPTSYYTKTTTKPTSNDSTEPPTPNISSEESQPTQTVPPPVATKGGGGVDDLLEKFVEKKTTTVAKTSADWEHFKETTGLGEKLEEQAESSTSYLKKQDFLHRVDHRKFELEKQERDRERARRGS